MSEDAIAAIGMHQRQRVFCIRMQGRINNATEALIRSALGWRFEMPEKERAAINKQAQAIRAMVEKGGGDDQVKVDLQRENVLSAVTPTILAAAQGRAAFDALRDGAEKQMRKLAKTLPVYPWAESVNGLGELGLAVIVAECGDLANYSNPAKVWKRLGLAVINGERQRKKANVEEAAAHGYNPRRRAEMFAVVGDPLFRAQSQRADKETGEVTREAGPYRLDYDRKKVEYLAREGWTPKHADNAARRYMTKCLLKDLWRAWREASGKMEPIEALPPAEPFAEAAE